jgi:hypothetical protein
MNQDIKERFERLEKEFNDLKELLERKPEIKQGAYCKFYFYSKPDFPYAGPFYGYVDGRPARAACISGASGHEMKPGTIFDHAEPIEQREVVGRIERLSDGGDIQIYLNGDKFQWLYKGCADWRKADRLLGDRQEMELYA